MTIPFAIPIQILKPTGDHCYLLHIDHLENVLNSEDIQDRDCVVVSVAGAIRQGKSFLLNFYLQYLYAQYKRNDVSLFLSNDIIKFSDGFSWRSGSKPETAGIWMWSEIFTHDYENGDKIAIILIDTQGSFDFDRNVSAIFTLSAMLSSVLCYNLMHTIREDDLQYLQLFTEYGHLSHEESSEKPFQKLLFIVRDWPYAFAYDYVWLGGQQVVNKCLENTNEQTEDRKRLRDQLRSSFTDINGFLMPYPGDDVARGRNYDQHETEITPEFREMLIELIAKILSPNNLVIKKINGQNVRAKDLSQYLRSYLSVLNGIDTPEPKSIFNATADIYYLIAHRDALTSYVEDMKKAIATHDTYFTKEELLKLHTDMKNKYTTEFSSKPKFGGTKFADKYLQQLEVAIAAEFEAQKNLNDKKQQNHLIKMENGMTTAQKRAVNKSEESVKKELTA